MVFGNCGNFNDDIWINFAMSSLFIEQHNNGIAFYIDGDLQFDTADEALYHEYLVIPAIALAVQRFPQTNLRVLICGGGDGLAARDVLRFPEVSCIDLVDYNPEVLELGRTVFKPYNAGSLESDRVTVHTQEAFEFISTLKDNLYHVVICDFTYPTCSEETRIYSREWFAQINSILTPSGVICTNGVSPENNTTGFWCLYQTLLASGLTVKPLQIAIPSFWEHDYGNWGFLIASNQIITKSELETISLPSNLEHIRQKQLLAAFVFKSAIAQQRHHVLIHTLAHPQLFYYLLNPTSPLKVKSQKHELTTESDSNIIDFLDIQETGTAQVGRDLLQLESAAQLWMEQIYASQDQDNPPNFTQLLPVRHRYHSPKMTTTWLEYLNQLLAEVDLSRLLNSLLARVQELPPQIASELKQLAEKIRSGQPLSNLPPKTSEFIMMLSFTLLMANLVTPDAVFAKGYYGGRSGYASNDSSYDGGEFNWKTLGFLLASGGGIWLFDLLDNSNDE